MDRPQPNGYHVPIMAKEVIAGLEVGAGTYVDCTLGGGGHSELILKAHPEARLIGIDKDLDSIAHNRRLVESYPNRVTLIHNDYTNVRQILEEQGDPKIAGALLDLGLSSHQIDTPERGFSYMADAKLDMRMNREDRLTAYEIVNTWSEHELWDTLKKYGEEPFAKKIATAIAEERRKKAIDTTLHLARICEKCVPTKHRFKQGHPAKRTFQAIRIAVNSELVSLEKVLLDLVDKLRSGGRLAVISFHSGEDRIVKQTFKLLETDCICDKNSPVCICGHSKSVKQVGAKFAEATDDEIAANPRAASAKLRIIEKL